MSETIARKLSTAVHLIRPVSDSPELDASLLLAQALNKPRSYLIAHATDRLPAALLDRVDEMISRRAAGEPVAYIIGRREFWSLDLRVTPDVLIPRPETETLVARALRMLPPDQSLRVADLGTGSGAIALAVAHERPRCRIIATDIAPAALAVARENAQQLGIRNVEFRQGDWYAALQGEKQDLLLSNPPYVRAGDPHMEAPAMAFEPRSALIAPGAGMRWLRELIKGAPAQLRPGGSIVLEHGADQPFTVHELLVQAGFVATGADEDLAGHTRVSFGSLQQQTWT